MAASRLCTYFTDNDIRASETRQLDCGDPTYGRFLRISIVPVSKDVDGNNDALTLCEVEIYGRILCLLEREREREREKYTNARCRCYVGMVLVLVRMRLYDGFIQCCGTNCDILTEYCRRIRCVSCNEHVCNF